MQPFSLIPQELLFHCITGYSNPGNRSALKIFICSGVKLTCQEMYKKVDQCWMVCLEGLSREWRTCLKTPGASPFIHRWIEGKPKFSRQTLHSLLAEDFQLKLEDKEKLRMISYYHSPTIWTSHHSGNWAAYSRGTPNGDLALIDLKNRRFLGELQNDYSAYPVFKKNMPPIFHGNNVVILFFHSLSNDIELRCYSLAEPCIQEISMTKLPFSAIRSMHFIQGHVVFHLKNKIAAISLESLKNSRSPSFLYSDMQGLLYVEDAQDKLLVLRKGAREELVFQFLHIEDQNLKMMNCLVKEPPVIKNDQFCYRQAFHPKTGHFVFLYQDSEDTYRIGSISPDAVVTSSFKTIQGFHYLVEFKDSLLLCSRDHHNGLQIQVLELNEEAIELRPLEISGVSAFNVLNLISAECFLDKLFLVGFLDLNSDKDTLHAEYHLIIIDMATRQFERSHSLGDLIIKQISVMSSSLGKIHVMISQNDARYILKVDYS